MYILLRHGCLKNISVYRLSCDLDLKNVKVFYCYFFQMGTQAVDGVIVLICTWLMGRIPFLAG